MSGGGTDPPRAPRRFGQRLVPSLVLPALVVTSLSLLVGERLRDRAQPSSPGSTLVVASAGGTPNALPARTTALLSSRRFVAQGAVRKGPPTMRHLDPARTNRSPFLAPTRPSVAWTTELGAPIATAPIVASAKDGSPRLVITTLAGSVVLLDPSGRERARVELAERIYGSPAVGAGLVWVGLDRGSVVGLDPDNGKIVRRLRLERDKDDADTAILPDEGAPATIFFAAGPTVYRVRTDGTFLFRETLPRKVYGSPARLRDGGVVVGGQDDTVSFLEADGRIRKRVTLSGDVDGSPAVADDGTVYVGTDGDEVVALAPAGEILWRRAVHGPVRGALGVARDGVVLVSTYGPTPAILGLDPTDGHPVLRFGLQGTGAREHGIHGAPIEAEGGILLFGGPDDQVHALGPDGSLLWAVDVGDDVDGTLALIDDRVLIATTSAGRVVRIDAAP